MYTLYSRIAVYLTLFFLAGYAVAQGTDPVLLTVGGQPVTQSEFIYLYKKTNSAKSDFSRASLDEYLELFSNFRLKVRKAQDLQVDTVPTLQRELENYRRQLTDSYLIDREVTDNLVREAYEHSKFDYNPIHILINIKSLSPADTLAAYNKAVEVRNRIPANVSASDFAALAGRMSEDPGVKENGGQLGWLTALLPTGFYDLEKALYNTTKGEVVGPVRSPMGYHVLYMADRRPARGEIEVAHILIREPVENPAGVSKSRIDAIHKNLKGNPSLRFEDVAQQESEDQNTRERGGYLGFFGISRFDPAFEDAAFALTADGQISEPIKTSVGWHIIKRISIRSNESYDIAKNRLKPRVQRDERFNLARQSMIQRIKAENNFKLQYENLKPLYISVDSTLTTASWLRPKEVPTLDIMSIGQRSYPLEDFVSYLENNPRMRMELGKSGVNAPTILRSMLENFSDEQALRFEEDQLSVKYPEFRFLMQEYRDGMMLFETTRQLVWDQASKDSVGLEKYFDAHIKNYMWKERAVVETFTLRDVGAAKQAEILKMLGKKGTEATLRKYNATEQVLFVREETFEQGRTAVLDQLRPWKKGQLTKPQTNTDGRTTSFYRVKSVIPPSPKTLKEARGYVVSDYQDQLEKDWIDALRKEYPVVVNRAVFDALVK
jgi:peptidyl-prolyl cis-trans isomerase SurA